MNVCTAVVWKKHKYRSVSFIALSGVGVRLKVGDKYWEDWRGGVWGGAVPSPVGGLGKKSILRQKLCNSEQVLVLLSYITAESGGDYPSQSWKWGTYPLPPLLRRLWISTRKWALIFSRPPPSGYFSTIQTLGGPNCYWPLPQPQWSHTENE